MSISYFLIAEERLIERNYHTGWTIKNFYYSISVVQIINLIPFW